MIPAISGLLAVTGTALVVVLLGWVVALLPVFDQTDTASDDSLVGVLRPHTVVVTLAATASVEPVVEALRGVDGVTQVAAIGHLDLLPPAVRPSECCSDGTARIGERNVRAVIADCDELGDVIREDSLPTVRGRLLVDRQLLRRFGQLDLLDCRYDEYETDTLDNQLLAAGLNLAARTAATPAVRALARRVATDFADLCAPHALDPVEAAVMPPSRQPWRDGGNADGIAGWWNRLGCAA